MQGTQHARLFDRLLERAPDYVSFILVILVGFLLARLTWMLFPAEPRLSVAESTSVQSGVDAGAVTRRDLGQEIASYHLFGLYQADTDKPVDTHVQPTQLNLKLHGVYAPSGNSGYAIIEANGKQQAYAAGDVIGNSGAVLEKVLGDHVLLQRGGMLEKLELPKQEQGGGGAVDYARNRVDSDVSPGMPEENFDPPREMFNPSEGAVPPARPEFTMPTPESEVPPDPVAGGESLIQFRKSVLNNNMRLLEVATPQPYERDGQFLGFQLVPGSNIALFNQLGLQSGDIVTAVNGTPLDSPPTAMKVLQEAATASQVNLNITRNGQEISLPVNFQ